VEGEVVHSPDPSSVIATRARRQSSRGGLLVDVAKCCVLIVQVGAVGPMAVLMLSERIAGRLVSFATVAFVAYALSFAFGAAPRVFPLTLSAGLTVAAFGLPLCFPGTRLRGRFGVVLALACFVAIAW